MDLKDLWLATLKDLSEVLPRGEFITWFKDTAILSIDEKGLMTVGLPLLIFLDRHQKRLADATLKSAQSHRSDIIGIHYEILSSLKDGQDPRAVNTVAVFPAPSKSRKVPNESEIRYEDGVTSKMLNSRYSLENFVVAPCNRMAHAAAKTVAAQPGGNYNPLFIHGGVGLGKTHLLQSIGREVLRNDPSKVVVYTTTESFTNELINGIKSGNMEAFRKRYRRVDVFIIDDIQFIANKDTTQEEFFHTFNTLFEAGKQIVISSDRNPGELKLLQDRIVSRFTSGLTVDVMMPDYESRMAILRENCREKQIFIAEPVLDLIAQSVTDSVRTLIGVLTRIIAKYEIENITPTLPVAMEILRQSVKTESPRVGLRSASESGPILGGRRVVTLEVLTEKVSDFYAIPVEEIKGQSRIRECLVPRQVVMYLAREKMRVPLARIGQFMGNRNHTTVMNGVRNIEEKIKQDRRLLCDMNAISRETGLL